MKRQKLSSYTERAIRATEAGRLIPPIVYLPRLLRSKPVLLTTDMPDQASYRCEPPTLHDNEVRIREVDPLGFLIAVMHGQPIPEFRVTNTGNIALYYAVPKLQERMRAAEFMSGVRRGPKLGTRRGGASGHKDETHDDAAYAAMLEGAASRASGDARDPDDGED